MDKPRAATGPAFGLLLSLVACACGPGGGSGAPRLDEPLAPGQVRAGLITRPGELLQGPDAHGWLGDYKLYNDRVAFVIENPFEPRGWGPYGGSVLDADWIRPDGQPADEQFEELFPLVELMGVEPTAAELVADGADGGPALLRLRGVHRGIPLIDAGTNGALAPLDLEIVQEYELAPDADHLLIRTKLRVESGPERDLTVGDVLLNGDRTTDFTPGPGDTGGTPPAGELDYLAGYGPDVCLLYAAADGPIRPAFSVEGMSPITAGRGLAPRASGGAEPLVVERWLLVGRGGMDDCLRRLRRLRGEQAATGLVAGRVETTGSDPEAGARIYVHDLALPAGADVVDQAFSAADGGFELELVAGDYRLEVRTPGREPVFGPDLALAAGAQLSQDLEVPAPAVLGWACTGRDRGGQPTGALPCKISLQAGLDAPRAAPVATDFLTFSAAGQGELVAPPGDWTATLSRGWEYSIERRNVSLQPGSRVAIEAELTHQVDSDGWIAADLHNHSTRSADSEIGMLDKLRANVVEGLELMVATDHDCQADFAPWMKLLAEVDQTEVSRWLRTVIGNEVSPIYGHLTAFPLPTHDSGWIYWQIPWVEYQDGLFARVREFPELFARARELGAEVINVAHPTESSGWFHYLGYAPPEVMPPLAGLEPTKFDEGFDTIELLNSNAVDTMLTEVLPLWSALNNQGLFRTAVGVSDSHGRTSEAGFGRTMIACSDDRPAELDLDEVWRNLKAGHALVGGGILVALHIQDAGPGDLLQATGTLAVHVHVEAADWVPVDSLELIANGQTIATRPLAPPGQVDPSRPAIRLDDDIQVEVTQDTWFAALAQGAPADRLDPVFRGDRPVGLTNAIRVDADGNGQFDPPGR